MGICPNLNSNLRHKNLDFKCENALNRSKIYKKGVRNEKAI